MVAVLSRSLREGIYELALEHYVFGLPYSAAEVTTDTLILQDRKVMRALERFVERNPSSAM